MATTTIHFGEKHMERLLKGFDAASLTDGLYNHDIDMEFSGARTVHVKSILTTPLQTYDPTKSIDTGSRYGTTVEVSDDEQVFEMGDKISLSLTIDKTNNVDQFNMKKAGEVMQAYKEEQIVPYLDKYRMNKWATNAGISYSLSAALSTSNVAQAIIKARNTQRNRRVTGKTVLIIPYKYLDVLALSEQWVKLEKLGTQVLAKGTVGQFYGMDVIPFIDELMPANVDFMIINPKAAIAPRKINSFKGHVDPPRINGDLLEFLMYHDAFVLGKKADGILIASQAANIAAAPTFTKGTDGTYTLASTTSSATIYYTTNGADPRYSKDVKTYSSKITVASGDQIRAYAAGEGLFNSGVSKLDVA